MVVGIMGYKFLFKNEVYTLCSNHCQIIPCNALIYLRQNKKYLKKDKLFHTLCFNDLLFLMVLIRASPKFSN